MGIPKSVQIVVCDLSCNDQVAQQLSVIRPAVVFHLAANVTSSAPPSTIIQSNVAATLNLLNALDGNTLKQFVYCGTGSEYGAGSALSENSPLRPTNLYGATKAAGHLLAHAIRRAKNLPIISVRPFTTYGPWEPPRRLIPFLCCRALDGADIPLTRADQQRDFIYVDDVVEAIIRVVGIGGSDELEAINISSGAPVAIRKVVTEIVALAGGKASPKFGVLPSRPGTIECGDASLARRLLGWSPQISLSDGLRRTLGWITEHRSLLNQLA